MSERSFFQTRHELSTLVILNTIPKELYPYLYEGFTLPLKPVTSFEYKYYNNLYKNCCCKFVHLQYNTLQQFLSKQYNLTFKLKAQLYDIIDPDFSQSNFLTAAYLFRNKYNPYKNEFVDLFNSATSLPFSESL